MYDFTRAKVSHLAEEVLQCMLQDAPTAAKKLDTDLDDYFKGKEAKKAKEVAAEGAAEGADASSEQAAAADDTAAAQPPAAE
jgi:hypothetical protein